MTNELPATLFTFATALAGIGWLALILFPRRPWANLWLSGVAIPAVLGVLYTATMGYYWFQPPAGQVSGFLSLAGLRGLFDNPGLLLSGYIDLLVFPLLAGAWMARKAAQIGMPFLYLLPCLVLTFVLPATGFVVFVLIVEVRRQWPAIAKAEGVAETLQAMAAAR